jgi:diaminohydroxyphosphoribosylaminopyrimidine deaminase / 5-amino-6-(5-phosphoribosylamino)uracil reductase
VKLASAQTASRKSPKSQEATGQYSSEDERLMRECLAMAAAQLGFTSPNPAVGCVIVRAGRIIGRGATAVGGRPHAETQALAEAGQRARGATAYVSLEPCAHRAHTPACARALVDAGVARVVIGCLDPYPPVRGRGVAILKAAGIATTRGVLDSECRRLNEGFITRVTRGRPFVIVKLAMSLDGRIAAPNGDSRWISSEESRRLVHQWRREADVVMVGAATVMADNPRLTCRLEGGRDPVRAIVDQRLRVPATCRVFRQHSDAATIIVTGQTSVARVRQRYGPRIEPIGVASGSTGLVLSDAMREFARRGWSKVLIEGGAHLTASALREGIVDRVAIFVAPLILGGGLPSIEGLTPRNVRSALKLSDIRARRVGEDWLLEGELNIGRLSRRSA